VWTGLALCLSSAAPVVQGQTAAGRAFRFDGVNDYAFGTNFGFVAPTTAITIEAWMRPEYNTNQYIIALDPEEGTNRIVLAGPWSDGRMIWGFAESNVAYLPPVTLSNTWNHFAVVAGAGSMRIYRNGVLETNRPGADTFVRGNYLLEIGGASTHGQYFRGQVDEVRIWNVARTQSEIQFNMHRPLEGDEAGLRAYYRFDEFTGALLGDSTTNGLNAVLTNAFTTGSRLISQAPIDRIQAATLPVTNVTLTTATLGSFITSYYWTTTVWFAWGPVGSTTNIVSVGPVPDSGTNLVARSAPVTGLLPGVSYECQVFASNGPDTTNGVRQFFKTLSLSNTTPAGLQGVISGEGAWGDYDNDGDFDLFLAGQSTNGFITTIQRNDGGGVFTAVYSLASMAALSECAGAWGDYDNDGDLDVIMSGRQGGGGARTFIVRNDGTNFFTISLGSIPGTAFGSLAWGDYDNDGDLDVLITGTTNNIASGAISRIYRNDGGTFTNSGVALRNVFHSKAAWGDYDRDGRLDILLAGEASSPGTNTLIYRSLGPAGYTNAETLQGTRRAAVAWGDFDRDDELDLAVAGATNISGGDRSWSGTYYRTSGDNFALGFSPLAVFDGAVAWGDFDNDGGNDLVVSGNDEGFMVAAIYRHTTAVSFVNAGEILGGAAFCTLAWGDYDNDGDLDLLQTGSTNNPPTVSGCVTRLYVNHTMRSNTSPGTPLFPGASIRGTNGDSVLFTWSTATDLETTNLTYNMRVGTTPGGVEVVTPHSDLATGRRLLPEPGNCGFAKFGLLTNMNPFLAYYYSAQAVDGAFRGGPWTAEKAFHYVRVITEVTAPVTPTEATLRSTVHPYGADTWAWFEWGSASPAEFSTAPQYLGALLEATNVSAVVAPLVLPPLTDVYCRAVASNSFGTLLRGELVIFKTPWLAASMSSVSNGLAPGQFNACVLSLTNLTASAADMTFSFEGGTPAWLGATGPLNVAANGTATLGLVFSAFALTPGTYTTTLIVSSAGLPDARIPVMLNVGTPYTAKPGDLNKDGVVDLMELNTVIQYYRGLLP